jgi:hypothetical protein
MRRTVHVQLEWPRAAAELVDFLAGCGLEADVVRTNGCCELEVGYAGDPDERLHDEVASALRTWLSSGQRPLVLSEADGEAYVLRPPGE